MLLLILIFIIISSGFSYSQEIEIKNDNGNPVANYSYRSDYEETVMLKPDGPCDIKKIRIYLAGNQAAKDTIYIVGDPAEGAVAPTMWVLDYNTIYEPIEVEYPGNPGWYEFETPGLRCDGFDRILIQHRMKPNGPFFGYDDNSAGDPLNSWWMDPNNNNTLGFPGVYYRAPGDFLIRLFVEYDYPFFESSLKPPYPQFENVTVDAGLVNDDGNPISGALISVADWNGDGYDDVAVGSSFFQNNGDGTFTNVSSQFNITAQSTVWADMDNDGSLDCFAMRGGGNDKIYWGNGDGTFTEETDGVIVLDQPTVTPMFFDYNRDGLLDLFVAYGRNSVNGNETYYPDKLFKNIGNRKFEDVTGTSGISAAEPAPYYDTWGASICDYNSDGLPDVFVATYRLAPDLLHRNNGDGTFTDVGQETGVRGVPTSAPQYFGHGMGSDWGDFDNDGDMDLAVGNLGHPDWRGAVSNPSLIFKNTGLPGAKYSNYTAISGLKFFEMNSGIVWGDFNQDGLLDLFHCQYSYDKKGTGADRFSRLYFNTGKSNEYELEDVTWKFMEPIHGAWSPVRIDYDGDGDLDLLIASNQEYTKLYKNNLSEKGNWITFRLKGSPLDNVSNDAFGASVRFNIGAMQFVRDLPGTVITARASQATNELHFGIGDAETIDKIIVRYSNGNEFEYNNLMFNTKYLLEYGKEPVQIFPTPPQLLEPANLITGLGTTVTFKWLPIPTSAYSVTVFKDGDLENPVATGNTNNTESIIEGLEDNTLYHWKVMTGISHQQVESEIWSFFTGVPIPKAPNFIIPMENVIDGEALAYFAWTGAKYQYEINPVSSYTLQISAEDDFSNLFINVDGLLDTKYRVDSPLAPGSVYFVRVRAENYKNPGPWSDVIEYKVRPLPGTISLVSPLDNVENIPTRPNLEWKDDSYSEYYHLQLSTDNGFNELEYEKDKISNTKIKLLNKLDPDTDYYWRVRGWNDGGYGDWSQVFTFRTEPSTSVSSEIKGIVSATPVPAVDKLRLNIFDVSLLGKTAKISDASGKLIMTNILVSEIQEFDISGFNAGIYFIGIENGKNKYTIKFLKK